MKKTFSVSLLIFVCVSFFGCANFSGKSEPITKTSQPQREIEVEYLSLFGTEGFHFAIHENPIDQAFNAIEFGTSTSDIIRINNEFRVYWEAEIDATLERLYGLMREEDAELLRNAQRTWEEYMAFNNRVRISLFYEDFLTPEPYGVANGMLDRIFMNSVHLKETRARAIELMELYFRFTGEVQFVYEN